MLIKVPLCCAILPTSYLNSNGLFEKVEESNANHIETDNDSEE